LSTHRTPVAERDLAVVAPAGDGDRAAVLLRAENAVGELVVGDDVIGLGGRLVVPGAPGLAAVDGDRPALVDADGHDPGVVVVVATRRAPGDGEGLAGVGGVVPGRGADVDFVGVVRGDGDPAAGI